MKINKIKRASTWQELSVHGTKVRLVSRAHTGTAHHGIDIGYTFQVRGASSFSKDDIVEDDDVGGRLWDYRDLEIV